MPKPLILASSSPRRRELLAQAGVDFVVLVNAIEETFAPHLTEVAAQVEDLARRKAEAVAQQHPDNRVVLGADTVVCIDNQILGKPENTQHAYQMLEQLSGRWHEVITGIALIQTGQTGQTQTAHARSRVKIRATTPQERWDYIATGEPLDKAGAYAIQGEGGYLVEGYEGDYTNIVGLPMNLLQELLQRHFAELSP